VKPVRHISVWISACLLLAAATCYASYRIDCYRLRAAAIPRTAHASTPHDKVLALLQMVHAIPETSENEQFVLLRRLRATPLQVLSGGGDCADKSRLLSAMLRQIEIPATMVMCHDPRTLAPTHTVVCAFTDDKQTMVVDPAYGLFFPTAGSHGYYGLNALRNDPSILTHRLAELRAILPASHPVHAYNASASSFAFASSINWNKNSLIRSLHDVLHSFAGDALYSWPRPLLLEEPKLFVCILTCVAGMAAWLLAAVARRAARHAHARQIVRTREADFRLTGQSRIHEVPA